MAASPGATVQGNLWFDGACSGNPGPMGGGAVLEIKGHRTEHLVSLGIGTNNEAEYGGLIAGLRAALAAGVTDVTVHGDSQLILRQLEGRYQVKAANLRPFYETARALLARFVTHRLVWVPRDDNGAADAAARRAIQSKS